MFFGLMIIYDLKLYCIFKPPPIRPWYNLIMTQESSSMSDPRFESVYSEELQCMAEADQAMRRAWEQTGEWDIAVDQKNTERLKSIIDEIGWPTISKVGNEAVSAAWLLVQHADLEPEFQERCLTLMKQTPEGEVNKKDLAYLEDRVRVKQGKSTLYGTQFYKNEAGQFGPRPIEDIKNLNERRKGMGLGSFEEYDKEIRGMVVNQ